MCSGHCAFGLINGHSGTAVWKARPSAEENIDDLDRAQSGYGALRGNHYHDIGARRNAAQPQNESEGGPRVPSVTTAL